MVLTNGSTLLANIGIFIAIAHIFGVEKCGSYAYHFSLASLLGLVSTFGFPIYLQRELAADRKNFAIIHSAALSLKIYIDLLLSSCALALPICLPIPDPLLFYTFFASRVLLAYSTFLCCEFRIIPAFHIESYLTAFGNSFNFICAVVAAYATHNLRYVAFGILASQSVTLLLIILVWRWKWRKPILQFSNKGLWDTLKNNFPYAIDQGLSEFIGQLISTLIGGILGNAALGLFQAGLRVANGLMNFATIVFATFISRLSSLWKTDRVRFASESNYAALAMQCLGIASGVILICCGPLLTELLYPPDFLPLNKLWPLFGLFVTSRFSAAAKGLLLTAAGFQKQRVIANAAILLVSIATFKPIAAHFNLFGVVTLQALSGFLLSLIYALIAEYYDVRRIFSRQDACYAFTVVILGILTYFNLSCSLVH